jgi:hypothetical protein
MPQILASLPPLLHIKLPKNFLESYGIMVISAPANCAHPHRVNNRPGKVPHPVVFASIAVGVSSARKNADVEPVCAPVEPDLSMVTATQLPHTVNSVSSTLDRQ